MPCWKISVDYVRLITVSVSKCSGLRKVRGTLWLMYQSSVHLCEFLILMHHPRNPLFIYNSINVFHCRVKSVYSYSLLRLGWPRSILLLLLLIYLALLKCRWIILITRERRYLICSPYRLLELTMVWPQCARSTPCFTHLLVLCIGKSLILLGWVHEWDAVNSVSRYSFLLDLNGRRILCIVWLLMLLLINLIVLVLGNLSFERRWFLYRNTVLSCVLILLYIGIHGLVAVIELLASLLLKLGLLIPCGLILLNTMLISDLLSFWHLSGGLNPLLLTHSKLLLLLLLLIL